ncbi:ABC transporter ATP-binding protein [Paenibacillus guangzhouensis]|uniref:ABC transporter ATP-binding protein n=1 Tax=Paenibacillus guangzhouensis TaxID=1473112 RepID=UPI002AAF2569|nr:ABC transporter ATP-binding protein [Paenibacillus guangzhouensis]
MKVENISKIYKIYDKPSDRLKEALIPFGKKFYTDFHALNGISFKVSKGESLGILGKNGSGKSTLLKIITGVLTQTTGTIQVNGRISALLELGAGFNPEYTGIENIYLNGTIMGFSKEAMDAKIKDILDFADIGDFIYQPVKMYSSGMFARLAFAVAINVDPDILIVDEALSVGDMRFQQKCYRKIEEFKDTKTVIMVTHDISAITKYCDRAIWINEGNLMGDGSPIEIAKKYQAFMIDSAISKNDSKSSLGFEKDDNIDAINPSLDVMGDRSVEIVGISMFDELSSTKLDLVAPDQRIKISIKVKSNQNITDPIVGLSVKDRLGTTLFQTNSFVLNQPMDDLHDNEMAIYSFSFYFPSLNHGMYTISPAIASGTQGNHTQHCWIHDAIVFHVIQKQIFELEGCLVMNNIDFSRNL